MKDAITIPYTKIVLGTIYAVGIVTMAVLAPNALQALKAFGVSHKGRKRDWQKEQHVLSNSLYQAIRGGLIAVETDHGERIYRLTSKGEQRLALYLGRDLVFNRPQHWDGKWRIVIFDVREQRRRARDWLRIMLREFGFRKLQNSVWIFPYHCEEFITLLKTDAQFGRDVLYMTVERLEHDAFVREYFRV